MSTATNAATKRRARIPNSSPTTPAKKPKPKPKQALQRDALYGVAELRAITGLGERTVYAILRTIQRRPDDPRRKKYLVTGAEFLALRSTYFGYTDVA